MRVEFKAESEQEQKLLDMATARVNVSTCGHSFEEQLEYLVKTVGGLLVTSLAHSKEIAVIVETLKNEADAEDEEEKDIKEELEDLKRQLNFFAQVTADIQSIKSRVKALEQHDDVKHLCINGLAEDIVRLNKEVFDEDPPEEAEDNTPDDGGDDLYEQWKDDQDREEDKYGA